MARPKKQHLMATDLDVVPLGVAACGRIISRRRLIVPSRPARWQAIAQLGVACHDCQLSPLAAALS